MSDKLETAETEMTTRHCWEVANADTIHLLETFPTEIWLRVFDTIPDPQTLFSLTQVSNLWREILYPRKIEYLFPQVLGVLTAQRYFSQNDCHFLLKCRLVNKSWRAAINEVLEKGPDYENPQFEGHPNQLCRDLAAPTYFRLYKSSRFSLVESEILQAAFSSVEYRQQNLLLYSPSNVFPGRRLDINEGDLVSYFHYPEHLRQEFLDRHREIAKHFLQTVGHHFWHAKIEINHVVDVEHWYNVICENVSLLPNLKCLYIKYPLEDKGHPQVLQKSFPTLSNFQVLSLDHVPTSAVVAMLNSNPQIKVLILNGVKINKNAGVNFLLTLQDDSIVNSKQDYKLFHASNHPCSPEVTNNAVFYIPHSKISRFTKKETRV